MFTEEQMAFFHEIFHPSLPRLGPGDEHSTTRALDTLFPPSDGLPTVSAPLRVIDIGCGNGTPTLLLAKKLNASILAVDNYQPFLDELERRALAAGVAGKIRTCLMDMSHLGPEQGTFNLVWSEGALSIMGFREGLQMCFDLLVPGGKMAWTELAWFRPDPPQECRQFFAEPYPAMQGIDAGLQTIRSCGYRLEGHFTLPETSWLDSYFAPLENRLRTLRSQYAGSPWQLEMIEGIQREGEIYRRYSDYYGYVFYMMTRP